MKQYQKYAIVSGCVLLLLFGCKGKRAGDILSPETMKLVVWDMLRADEIAMSENIKDTVRTHYLSHAVNAYEQVFAIHHITKEQFYRSYKYYQERPDENKALLDSVQAFGNQLKVIQERKDSLHRVQLFKQDSVRRAADTLKAKRDSLVAKHDSLAVKHDTPAVKKDTARLQVAAKTVLPAGKRNIRNMRLLKDSLRRVRLKPGTLVQPH
jgi:hypothetical protein